MLSVIMPSVVAPTMLVRQQSKEGRKIVIANCWNSQEKQKNKTRQANFFFPQTKFFRIFFANFNFSVGPPPIRERADPSTNCKNNLERDRPNWSFWQFDNEGMLFRLYLSTSNIDNEKFSDIPKSTPWAAKLDRFTASKKQSYFMKRTIFIF
jgi:hypothetical protein